jgi:hypothetical protein
MQATLASGLTSDATSRQALEDYTTGRRTMTKIVISYARTDGDSLALTLFAQAAAARVEKLRAARGH